MTPSIGITKSVLLTMLLVSFTSQDERASQDKLRAMRQRVQSLMVNMSERGRSEPLRFAAEPLLRYSDQARSRLISDGSIWGFDRPGRPLALLTVEIVPQSEQREICTCEMIALADTSLSIVGTSGWKWTPRKSGLTFDRCPDAPTPADSDKNRLRQMKELARQFTASEKLENETIALRLLIQPIHRYAKAESGLVDGAIFVLAHGTNPEALLFIECRDEPGDGRAWFYGLARLSSAELVVRLGEREVWRQPNRVNLSNPTEAYFSANEPIPAREGGEK